MTDLIIIGAGPAGMTAALYAARAGKSVLMLEKETFGGQITYSPRVENYPGIKQISGNEWASGLVAPPAQFVMALFMPVRIPPWWAAAIPPCRTPFASPPYAAGLL